MSSVKLVGHRGPGVHQPGPPGNGLCVAQPGWRGGQAGGQRPRAVYRHAGRVDRAPERAVTRSNAEKRRVEVPATVVSMMGAITLARAVNDPPLSDEILAAVRHDQLRHPQRPDETPEKHDPSDTAAPAPTKALLILESRWC